MKNGKCPTWFVVKWLSKHPTHTADAPRTEQLPDAKASASSLSSWANGNVHVAITGWERSDWTIRNERGRKVRFKEKPELRRIGCVETGQELSINGISGLNTSDSVVDVFIRERKR